MSEIKKVIKIKPKVEVTEVETEVNSDKGLRDIMDKDKKMKILVVIGSPRKKGNSNTLAKEFVRQCLDKDIECDVLDVYDKDLKIDPCYHCKQCYKDYRCTRVDGITDILNGMPKYRAIVFSSPVYFYSFSARMKAFIDRLYSVDLRDKKLATILVSGSDFFEGGNDLIVEMMKRTCKFCGSIWSGTVQKTTNDEVMPLDKEDVVNLNLLVESIMGKDISTRCFIKD